MMTQHRPTAQAQTTGDQVGVAVTRRALLGLGAAAVGGALVPALAAPAFAAPALAAGPYADLRANWFAVLTGLPFDTSMPSIQTAVQTLSVTARGFADTMDTSPGRSVLWADLPLGTVSARARTSFNRVKAMALAHVTPGTDAYGDATVRAKAIDGLAWLVNNIYVTSLPPRGYDNWWDWQIGIPNAIEDTCTVLYDHITPAVVQAYCARIDHFTPAATIAGSTGANLLWWVRILILGGALSDNPVKITNGISVLSKAFVISRTGDGLYEDGSFIQHTARVPNVVGYGLAFLDTISVLTRLLAGSQWPITHPDFANIHNGVNRGLIPAVWEGLTIESMRGRGIAGSAPGDAGTGLTAANTVLRFAESVADPNQAAQWRSIAKGWLVRTPRSLSTTPTIELISRCEAVLRNSAVPATAEPSGFKIYYENDRAIHRRPGWCFAISACSARITRYEMVNSENLRGWHTGDGMTYLHVDTDRTQFGDAYWNTVDWYRLPGTTVDTVARADSAGANTRPTTTWAGGASSPNTFGLGEIGAFGQDLEAFGSTLRAKKSWFCLNDCVVALGAGITGSTDANIETMVENRNLHDNPNVRLTINGKVQPTTIGWSATFPSARWAHLDGVAGYVFPGPAATLSAGRWSRTGTWTEITATEVDPTPDTRFYATLKFSHGQTPSDASYCYMVLPKATRQQTAMRSANPGIEILANTATAQAIKQCGTGHVLANFFATGTAGPITAESGPASVVVRRRTGGVSVSVADPTRSLSVMKVRLSYPEYGYLAAVGESDGIYLMSSDSTGTTLLVEVGGAHGASRTIELNRATSTAQRKFGSFFTPTGDAFVRDGTYAGDTGGTSTMLYVKKSGDGQGNTGFSRRALVSFDARSVTDPVRRAVLWVNGRTNDSGGVQTQLQAFSVATGWTESTVTWNTAPALSTPLGTGWITRDTDWVGLDVTAAFAAGAGIVSFAIWQPAAIPGLLVNLGSKEAAAATQPLLEIISGPAS